VSDQSTRALRRLLGERIVAYNAAMARALGSVTAGLLLSQLLYWQERAGKDGDGWFWKTRDEITDETAMTRYEQETARKILVRHGVVEEKRMGVPARMFFRVSTEAVIALLATDPEQTGTDDESAETSPTGAARPPARGRGSIRLVGGNPTNCLGEIPPTNTESTREYSRDTGDPPSEQGEPEIAREQIALHPDAEDRLHRAGRSETLDPKQARAASDGPTDLGWTTDDIARIHAIFLTGEDPKSKRTVVKDGYPVDAGGAGPRRADANLIFTHVPKERANDLVAALRNYARVKSGSGYVMRLSNWILKGEWEAYVKAAPASITRLDSARQTTAPTHQSPHEEIAMMAKLSRRVLEA
jgi:hypothetical protein